MVQQHMPGSAVEIAKDASRMNERMSTLLDAHYGSMHQSITIPGETPSGKQWFWTDAIHVRLANDMNPNGTNVPTGLRLSPAEYETRMTLLPTGIIIQHMPMMRLSDREFKAIS